jgi:hypothetical protein
MSAFVRTDARIYDASNLVTGMDWIVVSVGENVAVDHHALPSSWLPQNDIANTRAIIRLSNRKIDSQILRSSNP